MEERPKRKGWIARSAAFVVVLAMLTVLLWAGWYVYNRGFTRKWREQLAAELRRRGLDLSAKRLTLNPFEGLVIEDAHLYLLDEHHTPLLYISRAAVDISVSNLIQRKPFLNSLDLRGARLTLPVDMNDPDGPKVKLRRFQAKLAFLPDEVRLTQATGDFYGIEISASGALLHPESFAPAAAGVATPEQTGRRRQLARTIIEEIQKVRSDVAQPRLEIRFEGDLAKPETLRASGRLDGEALRRGSYRLSHLLMRLDYDAGAFHLQQAELTDAHGTLSAQGDFDPGSGEARFQLQSSLDLLALAREFVDPQTLPELRLQDSPRLQLDGHARFGLAAASGPAPATAAGPGAAPRALPASNDAGAPPVLPLQFTGHLALGRFAYRGFDFERADTDFSWNADRWYVRGLRIVRPGGNGQQAVTADVLSEPTQRRVRLTSTIDPMPFVGLLPAKGQEALAHLEFKDPPRLELTATGPSLTDLSTMHAEGQIALGRTRYRGVGFNRLRGDLNFADGLVTGRHMSLERDEGSVTGEKVVYDFERHELRLDNVHSGIDPAQTGVWLDPDVYRTISPFHFRKPPALVMNGTVQFDGGRNSRLVTNVNAPGGMDYVFEKKNLGFTSIAGEVVFTEERMWLNNVRGEIFGGEAQGSLDLALGRRTKDYVAAIEVKNLDFAKVTTLYFDYGDSKGRLSGSYHFTGKGPDPRTLHGAGTLTIEHGNVFSIPFLGPFSTIIGTVLPGLGYDEAHQASVNFLTDGGKIYTGNMDVKGLGFSLFGAGWLGYVDDTMNFRVRINSRGLPGAVLYPMSKLLEYSSQGPLSKPIWRPRVLTAPAPGSDAKKAGEGAAPAADAQKTR